MFRTAAVFFVALFAFAPRAHAQTFAFAECKGGLYYEVKPNPSGPNLIRTRIPDGDGHCKEHKGLDGLALAINVQSTTYSGSDFPSCSGSLGAVDRVAGDLLIRSAREAAIGMGAPAEDFDKVWAGVLDKATKTGGDLAKLFRWTGGVPDKSACQGFVLRAPSMPSSVRYVMLEANQNQAGDDQGCGQIAVSQGKLVKPNPDGRYRCAIGFAGWVNVNIITNAKGAVVSGVFKNWSHNRSRTGLLWIFYQPATSKLAR